MMSLPSSPAAVSEPALAQMTSALVVPVRLSSAAVPVIVQLGPALTTVLKIPWAKAGPTIRPTVATDTKIVLILTPASSPYRSVDAPYRRPPHNGDSCPRTVGGAHKGPLRSCLPSSESELQLAVGDRVAGVDHARVGVHATVHGVVAGDVVLRLQEVVPGLVGAAAGVRLVLVPGVAARGIAATQFVVALATVELVVLVIAADLVVVRLALDDVGAVIAVAGVVALAELDDVVALQAGGGVLARLRADDIGPGGADQRVVCRRPRDRAIGTGVDDAVQHPVDEGGTDHQAHRRQGHEDRPDLHPASSLSRSRIPYVKPSKKAAKTGRQFSPELRPIE